LVLDWRTFSFEAPVLVSSWDGYVPLEAVLNDPHFLTPWTLPEEGEQTFYFFANHWKYPKPTGCAPPEHAIK
jgi:hypothetical protein